MCTADEHQLTHFAEGRNVAKIGAALRALEVCSAHLPMAVAQRCIVVRNASLGEAHLH